MKLETFRLNEDLVYNSNKMASLESMLNQDTKDVLSNYGFSSSTYNRAVANNVAMWERAKTQVDSPKELNALIQMYLMSISNYIQNGTTIKISDDAIGVLVKLVDELGFGIYENPILKFFNTLLNSGRLSTAIQFNNNDLILLNNISANSVFKNSDITGNGVDGKNHILYNSYFWDIPDISDKMAVANAYAYLSNPSNVKDYNYSAIDKYLYQTTHSKISASTSSNVRDTIIYEDGNGGKIRPYEVIRNAMSVANQGSDEETDEVSKIYSMLKDLSKTDRDSILSMLQKDKLI